MRILFLANEFPYPPRNGGTWATFNFLKAFDSLAAVDVLGFSQDEAGPSLIKEATCCFKQVHFLDPIRHQIRIRSNWHKLLQVGFVSIVNCWPYVAAKFWNRKMKKRIVSLLKENKYDAIVFNHLGMTSYLRTVKNCEPNVRLVVIEQNVESDLFKPKRGISLPLWILLKLEHFRVHKYEKKVLNSVDRVVAISSEDTHKLYSLIGKGNKDLIFTIVPPVESKNFNSETILQDKEAIYYMGTLSWPPNLEGLKWFVENVVPHLTTLNVPIRIIGGNMDRQLYGWLKASGLQPLGFVPQVDVELNKAFCLVVPILSGSGIRIKILDAFRICVPVVSTSKGAEGLPVKNGVHLLIEDDPKSFAFAVKKLVENPKLRQKLAMNAFLLLQREFGLETAVERLKVCLK
ncbi:glycosyltransferase [Desulfofundulus thermosubterraneus]|uniref:Glycosyl transferases group 1 n=1 Tax=Desulfofundulus thermosubterraneus DSM 16057 TaxID=1121432 RepID=A0A1M6LCJ5_9FIRM|nr:glycosyltransferase [Desulfofundulus thermosubterraneus]SHJ68868.1 Glycosyl transferases group 1 [Desulfofundulus thermosubterraneus DSM 16057]